jgi:anti-sigma B factor antagonist
MTDSQSINSQSPGNFYMFMYPDTSLEGRVDLICEFRKDYTIIQVNRRRATVDLAPELREKIASEVKNEHENIIINLDYVEFVDSSFLGALVAGLRLVKTKGGRILVVGLHPHVRTTFELTHMDRIFPVYISVEEAIRRHKQKK